jgi:hypothetical protein
MGSQGALKIKGTGGAKVATESVQITGERNGGIRFGERDGAYLNSDGGNSKISRLMKILIILYLVRMSIVRRMAWSSGL